MSKSAARSPLAPAMLLLVLVAAFAAAGPAAAPAASGAPAAQGDGRFMLGVLRADGILLPFASFDDGVWRASWPADLAGRDVPTSLDAVPRGWWGGSQPSTWRVFGGEPAASSPVKPVSLLTIMIGAEQRLALGTDRQPAPVNVPPQAVPFPKIGLAVGGQVDVTPVAMNSPGDSAAWQFLQPIRSLLNAAEERTLSALSTNTGWKHPIDRAIRTRLEPQLEAWYSTPLEGGARVSYIEIAKKYPPGPADDGCGLETFITGWVHQSGKPGRPRTELRATVMYCDRDRASYMLPFGQITVRNRVHWIFQMSGADHEWYAVAEVTPSRVRVVAEYHAGGFLLPGRLAQ